MHTLLELLPYMVRDNRIIIHEENELNYYGLVRGKLYSGSIVNLLETFASNGVISPYITPCTEMVFKQEPTYQVALYNEEIFEKYGWLNMPERPYRVDVSVWGFDWENIKYLIEDTLLHVREHGEHCSLISSDRIVTVIHSKNALPEAEYKEKLLAFFDKRREISAKK